MSANVTHLKLNQWTQAGAIQFSWWRKLDYDLFIYVDIKSTEMPFVYLLGHTMCAQLVWCNLADEALKWKQFLYSLFCWCCLRNFGPRWRKCMLYQTSPFTLSLSCGKLYIAIFVSLYADVCVHWQGGSMLTGLWADADQTGRQGGWMSGHSQQVVWMR